MKKKVHDQLAERSTNQVELFMTLKIIMRQKKISYKELSKMIDCSESTIKSIFHDKNTSVERLIEMCEAIDLPFHDLVRIATRYKESEFCLNERQERFLAQNPIHYFVFRSLFFKQIDSEATKKHFSLSQQNFDKILQDLANIDLLKKENKKLKFQVQGKQTWTLNGPWMQKFFAIFVRKMTQIILNKDTNSKAYSSNIGFMTLSSNDYHCFIGEVSRIEKKYKEIAYQDFLLNRSFKGVPVTWSFNIVPFDIYDLVEKDLIKGIATNDLPQTLL